jgi:hypothetical protein
MSDFYPNFLVVLLRMPLAYLPVFGLITQFGHPSVGERVIGPIVD